MNMYGRIFDIIIHVYKYLYLYVYVYLYTFMHEEFFIGYISMILSNPVCNTC